MCMYFTVPVIVSDEDMSQPVSVENRMIRVRIGYTAFIVDGPSIQIVCNTTSVYSGHPITFSWLHNGEHYKTRRNVTMITVTDANHGDVFTCVAENVFGSNRKDTKIIFVHEYFCI